MALDDYLYSVELYEEARNAFRDTEEELQKYTALPRPRRSERPVPEEVSEREHQNAIDLIIAEIKRNPPFVFPHKSGNEQARRTHERKMAPALEKAIGRAIRSYRDSVAEGKLRETKALSKVDTQKEALKKSAELAYSRLCEARELVREEIPSLSPYIPPIEQINSVPGQNSIPEFIFRGTLLSRVILRPMAWDKSLFQLIYMDAFLGSGDRHYGYVEFTKPGDVDTAIHFARNGYASHAERPDPIVVGVSCHTIDCSGQTDLNKITLNTKNLRGKLVRVYKCFE